MRNNTLTKKLTGALLETGQTPLKPVLNTASDITFRRSEKEKLAQPRVYIYDQEYMVSDQHRSTLSLLPSCKNWHWARSIL